MDLKSKLIVVLVMLSTQFAFGETTNTGDCDEPQNFEVESTLPQVEQRIAASTGEVFTKDTSIPELGDAYKDPSGNVWGDIAKYPNGDKMAMNFDDANKYCKEIAEKTKQNVRLPSKDDFIELKKYLGSGSPKKYSPLTDDGKETLPSLQNNGFWSSSENELFTAYFFDGYGGDISYFYRFNKYAVRCVAGR